MQMRQKLFNHALATIKDNPGRHMFILSILPLITNFSELLALMNELPFQQERQLVLAHIELNCLVKLLAGKENYETLKAFFIMNDISFDEMFLIKLSQHSENFAKHFVELGIIESIPKIRKDVITQQISTNKTYKPPYGIKDRATFFDICHLASQAQLIKFIEDLKYDFINLCDRYHQEEHPFLNAIHIAKLDPYKTAYLLKLYNDKKEDYEWMPLLKNFFFSTSSKPLEKIPEMSCKIM